MPQPNLRNIKYRRQAQIWFYLFDQSWCFFPLSPVKASMRTKVGSVMYEGPFSVQRRPAQRIPFSDTEGLASSLNHFLSAEESEPISFAEYKQLEAKGNPLVLEFGLKNTTELGRRTYGLGIADYGNWLELSRQPWKQGYFWPWADWTKVIRVTPSRETALRRAALALQTEFPPSGFEFKPGRGLVEENILKYSPSKHRKKQR